MIAALGAEDAAAPALAVTDALWRGGRQSRGCRTGRVSGARRRRRGSGRTRSARRTRPPGGAADDVEVARAAGLAVAIVAGDEANVKITMPGDFARGFGRAGRWTSGWATASTCTGSAPGDHVMLCGVPVPLGRGLQGHSDADVGLHTIADAIYGALAEGDIGRHFPPSEAEWKGADSALFLRHAAGLARERGFVIGNIDATLICEAPKIGPHAEAMRARVAEIAGIEIGRVSVKATTTERLGFAGRGEGIACMATVTLVGRERGPSRARSRRWAASGRCAPRRAPGARWRRCPSGGSRCRAGRSSSPC